MSKACRSDSAGPSCQDVNEEGGHRSQTMDPRNSSHHPVPYVQGRAGLGMTLKNERQHILSLLTHARVKIQRIDHNFTVYQRHGFKY